MKKAEEYLQLDYGNLRDGIISAIEQAQKEAYNEAVNDSLNQYLFSARSDKEQSILQLIKP